MSLTKEDLQAITQLVGKIVSENNEVLRAEMQGLRSDLTAEIQGVRSDLTTEIQGVRSDLTTEIQGVRSDLTTEIQGVRSDLRTEIADSKNQIFAYIESHVEKQIHQIADGHMALADKLNRMDTKLDTMQLDVSDVKSELLAHEIIYMNDKGIKTKTEMENYNRTVLFNTKQQARQTYSEKDLVCEIDDDLER